MKKNLAIVLFVFSTVFYSQEEQPKIGLVLSGGGAKGFAHIGVLKEIDAAGLQIDYIGGTSMGAVIGGLYAVGYSGKQIEQIILETDFLSLLQDKLPRSSVPFFEKEYGEKTVITLPVQKGIIGLPKAISKGQNVLSLLLELLDPIENSTDFSKLQIPFFCIGTNVEKGIPVLLEKGSLAKALRASASFPSLLNPIEIDNQLLIDGGVANNFPADIMKKKGMDIIIGVNVEGKLLEKHKLISLISVLNQIISYQTYEKSEKNKEHIDIYLHPEVFDYNAVSFGKSREILNKGNEAALKVRDIFKELAAKQKYKKKKEPIVFAKNKKYKISKINLTGDKNYTGAYLLGKLNIIAGDSISRKEITKKIHLLSATKNFDLIAYTLKPKADDNNAVLSFDITESKRSANLKLGVHYDVLYKSSVLATYNQKHLFTKNDLFSLDMILGDNLRYNLNYFVDNGFSISYGFRSRYNNFTSNSNYLDLPNYSDITNQVFFQTAFNRKFAFGFGLEHKWIERFSETVSEKNNYLNIFGSLKLDTYDKKYFVTKGGFADFNFKWYTASSGFDNDFKIFSQIRGKTGFATTFGNRFTIQNTNEAGFNLGNITSDVFDFYLGGYNQNYINTFISFYGYDLAELSGNTFLKTTLNFRYAFANKHYVSLIANYGRLDNNIFKDIEIFKDIKSGYALGYSYDTFIGPIEIKHSWSPNNKQNYWLFNLGFWF